jgi:hypothetical protein
MLGIPVAANPQLLRRAVESVPSFWPETVIIDNTELGLDQSDFPAEVIRPSVPLTFSQSMNFLQSLARERLHRAWLFLHSDAAVCPGTADAMLEVLERAFVEQRRWGVVFTLYDAFAAFNLDMVDEIGCWDITLPHYFADVDYYRRARLAGWELITTNLSVIHDSSAAINSDDRRRRLNEVTFPMYERYYEAKWGGSPGSEKFVLPFDGAT